MWRLRMREAGRSDGRTVGRSFPSAVTVRLWDRLRSTLKQVAGMPDYARYLEHAREEHPDCPLLSEREYYDRFIEGRYAGGGLRCC